MSFLESLDREGPNSSRDAMSLATTEAYIIAYAELANLSPAPANRVLHPLCLEMQAACPLAELNRQILQGGEGAPARPCLQARRVNSGTRSCLLVELT